MSGTVWHRFPGDEFHALLHAVRAVMARGLAGEEENVRLRAVCDVAEQGFTRKEDLGLDVGLLRLAVELALVCQVLDGAEDSKARRGLERLLAHHARQQSPSRSAR